MSAKENSTIDWARRRSQTVPPKSLSVSAVFRFRFGLVTITISDEVCVLWRWQFCKCVCSVAPGNASSAPVPFLAGFIQDPGVGEGGLPGLLRLLLILVHGALVDVAQQVQEVAHQGAFTCVHMTCRNESFKSSKTVVEDR